MILQHILTFALLLSPADAAKPVLKKVVEGDSIQSLLVKNQFTSDQAYQVLVQNVLPKSFIMIPGEFYRVSQTPAGRLEVQFFHPLYDDSFVFWKQGKDVGMDRQKPKFTVRKKVVRGEVRGSLIESIRAKVDSMWVAFRFMDAYTLDFNLKKLLQRGAPFEVTYEERYLDGDLVGHKEVLETELQVKERREARLFYPFPPGEGIFVNPEQPDSSKPLFAPVDYLRISSLFQPHRFHPIKRRYQAHLGVDFALPENSRVYAAASGRVLRSGFNRAAGNYVVIEHASGFNSSYNHLNRLADNLKSGQTVSPGQLIGFLGCTGYCTSPHLHFAVMQRGQYKDPIQFLKNYSFRKKDFVDKLAANRKSGRKNAKNEARKKNIN